MNELKNILAYTGIDVEHLVDLYTKTLHQNNNREATKEASIIALKEWAKNNEFLIRQVMAMPGYNGNLQSVQKIEIPYERTASDTINAIDRIWQNIFDSGDKILSKKNEDGKTIEDLIREEISNMPKSIDIRDIISYSGKKQKSHDEFNSSGYTFKSVVDSQKAKEMVMSFRRYTSTKIDDDIAAKINSIESSIGIVSGMKTTRAVGKIIKRYGLEDNTVGSVYGKEYISHYCEIMKDGGIKMDFIVSVHPVDYLKMSIGEFTSCHNINGGGWRSGCISYMLDSVSLITYTVKKGETTDPVTGEVVNQKERPELFKKVHRNVFHWDEMNRLIQSRVYPQANDGCINMYDVFRAEMQKCLAEANGFENIWTKRNRKFTEFTREGEGATNYADWSYERFGGNLSTPGHSGDWYSTEPLYIGTAPTCIVCGEKHSASGRMKCYSCY